MQIAATDNAVVVAKIALVMINAVMLCPSVFIIRKALLRMRLPPKVLLQQKVSKEK